MEPALVTGIRELREKVSVPVSEARSLLEKNSGNVEAAVREYIKPKIDAIVGATDASEKEAEEAFFARKENVEEAIASIRALNEFLASEPIVEKSLPVSGVKAKSARTISLARRPSTISEEAKPTSARTISLARRTTTRNEVSEIVVVDRRIPLDSVKSKGNLRNRYDFRFYLSHSSDEILHGPYLASQMMLDLGSLSLEIHSKLGISSIGQEIDYNVGLGKAFYYSIDGTQVEGPFWQSDVAKWCEEGKLPLETQVHFGEDSWWKQCKVLFGACFKYGDQKRSEQTRKVDRERNAIDTEIDQILSGKHGGLSHPNVVSSQNTRDVAVVTIKNETGFILYVLYSGPDSKKIAMRPEEKRSIELRKGEYRAVIKSAQPGVHPFAGRWVLDKDKYAASYSIKTTYK